MDDNKEHWSLLIDELREIERDLCSGDFRNGWNSHEAAELEAKAKKIQDKLAKDFPDLNPKVYRFNPE